MADGVVDFLTQQGVTGELLSERLARGPIACEETLRLAIEIGAALNRTHSDGQVHGGLCPLCIVLAADGVRLASPPRSPLDRAAYRAPEEIRGIPANVQSDIFAYGAVLYEMAAGRRAFSGTGP